MQVYVVNAWLKEKCPRTHCGGSLYRHMYFNGHHYRYEIKCLLCARSFTEGQLLELHFLNWLGLEI